MGFPDFSSGKQLQELCQCPEGLATLLRPQPRHTPGRGVDRLLPFLTAPHVLLPCWGPRTTGSRGGGGEGSGLRSALTPCMG